MYEIGTRNKKPVAETANAIQATVKMNWSVKWGSVGCLSEFRDDENDLSIIELIKT